MTNTATPKRTRATLSALVAELGAEKTAKGYRLHGYDVYRSTVTGRREWWVTYNGRSSTTPKRSATDALEWVHKRHTAKLEARKGDTGTSTP